MMKYRVTFIQWHSWEQKWVECEQLCDTREEAGQARQELQDGPFSLDVEIHEEEA